MSYVVGFVKANGQQVRLFFFDILLGGTAQGFGLQLFPMAQRQCVHQIFNAAPLVQATDFSMRTGFTQQLEHRRENAVLVQYARWKFRRLRAPFRVPVQFGIGSHEHACPVDGTGRRQHRTFLQRIGTVRHQLLDGRHLRLWHAIGAPPVQAD